MTARLSVTGLRVEEASSGTPVIDEIDLVVRAGEIVGVVGESGAGKTTLGLALLGHCLPGLRIGGGRVLADGIDVLRLPDRRLRALRGRTIGYVPQSADSALNPALRMGTQLAECLGRGDGRAGGRARDRIRRVLEEVALPADSAFLRRYPHQLSGGQQQRATIAMAFLGGPRLIVLDEPTTGLDTSTQARVVASVRRMCRDHGVAAVYVSHDMAVIAALAHRVAVMYAGRIVESGPTVRLLATPQHPYTRLLLQAVPDLSGARPMVGIAGQAPSPRHRPAGCAFGPRCPLAGERCRTAPPPTTLVTPPAAPPDGSAALPDGMPDALPTTTLATPPDGQWHAVRCYHPGQLPASPVRAATGTAPAPTAPVLAVRGLSARYGDREALRGINLDVPRGGCVALLGPSGSGKTTLARCVAGLHGGHTGEVLLNGSPLAADSPRRTLEQRHRLQYVFQDPYGSLNPRRTAGQSILRPLRAGRLWAGQQGAGRQGAGRQGAADRAQVLRSVLRQVALPPDVADRYPDQLSGGECQRVAIARALVTRPDILICDEITSALDVSVQSSIVELLAGLRAASGLSVLFITHDIALAGNVAQSVAVLADGRIVEYGRTAEVLAAPSHPRTRAMLADVPKLCLP